jgi:peptide/nickel transport system substrate-binding protein
MRKLDQLKTTFSQGRISRRGFVEGALALGMTLTGATSFMSAVEAATPKKGGLFRLGLGGASTTDSLDPATFISTFTQIGLNFGIHNNLTEVTASGDIVPELAESFEATSDAKVWTFKLRKGVEYHNGKSLEAADVVASIQHHRGEDSKSAAKPLLADIEAIETPDKHTVVFKLANGNADFPYVMNDYHLPILPSKDGKIDWQAGVGAGGYTLGNYDWGVRMELKRNPNYWKGDARSHFDEVMLIGIADAAARQNAMRTGEIDAMNRVDLKTAHLLARDANIIIDDITGNQHYTIPMNSTVAPFDNNDVRLALKYAINREELVKKILSGHGAAANDHPIGPGQKYFAKDLEQRAYDPDKAKHHLKKAGMENLKVDLHAANTAFSGAIDTALLYQEAAKAAGIEINVVREADDGYWTNVWMKKAWSMSYWGGRPTEDWMFTVGYAAGGAWNESFWSNDAFMKLLVEARAELDQAKRGEMYAEMQRLVRDDGGSVIPMYANNVDARSKKVANDGTLASNWELDGWKCLDRWWFV